MTARNAMQRRRGGLVCASRARQLVAAAPHRRANRLMTFTREMERLNRPRC
jgi:hypothetical protein